MNRLGRVMQFYRPDLHRVALLAFFLAIAAGASLLRPWAVAVVVDSVLSDQPAPVWLRSLVDPKDKHQMLALLAFGVLGLHLAQGGLWTALNWVSLQIGLNGMRRARQEIYTCLQRLSARFVQSARSGDLVHRTATDTYSIHVLFQQVFVTSAAALLMVGLMLVVLWRIDVTLTLVVFLVVPMILVAAKYFDVRVEERRMNVQQADSQVTSFVQNSIAALPLTLSCGREEFEASGFASRTAAAVEKHCTQSRWDLGYWLVVMTVLGLATGGVVWLGGRQILAGHLTLGELFLFLAFLPMLHEPVRHLSRVGAVIKEAFEGTDRIFKLLDTPNQVRESAKARAVTTATTPADTTTRRAAAPPPGDRAIQVRGNIEFDRVTYGDPREGSVLDGVSFRLEAGQSLAIAGANAVANATVLTLLPRFFDPTSGIIRIEGVDLRELRLKDLRAQMTLLPPEPILLPASIAENIAYGKSRARLAEVEAAARAAGAEEFIRQLPNGYQTTIGEGGTRLSAMERQRLGLACAFLRNTPILLVDEPAALLDPENEQQLAACLKELMKGRTTICAAQRLIRWLEFDQRLSLQDGQRNAPGSLADAEKR